MEVLQGEVFDGLGEDLLFEDVAFIEQLVGHFCVSLISVGELEGVDRTLDVILFGAVVADESVCRDLLVHAQLYYYFCVLQSKVCSIVLLSSAPKQEQWDSIDSKSRPWTHIAIL
jgi:hypothetical protein